VAASTQNQVLSALLFLYRYVLHQDLPWLDDVVRVRRPKHLPIVLTRDEVRAVISKLDGTPRLMAALLYGSGLRLLECARLRVQDVDFAMNQIIVRDGKGAQDRVTVLPSVVKEPLTRHLLRVKRQHEADLASGAGWVELPWALARKYPSAGREWPWQWAFPATRFYFDRVTGQRRRHHLHESVLQRAVLDAVRRSGLGKRATPHTFRHSLRHSLARRGFTPGPDFADNIKFYVPYLVGVGFGYIALIHLLRFILSVVAGSTMAAHARPNITFDRTAGSRSLATAGQRDR
jgi:integron integrase